MVHTKTANPR